MIKSTQRRDNIQNSDTQEYQRGDIYFADLSDGLGSEQGGTRPVVIIQNDTGNYFSPTVIVAAITGKKINKTLLPTHCVISQLQTKSIVLTEQIFTLDKRRLKEFVCSLKIKDIQLLNNALSVSLGLI